MFGQSFEPVQDFSLAEQEGQERISKPHLGLAPEVLLKEGILRDPSDPEQAFFRAKSLILQGRYRDARNVLCKHLHSCQGQLGTRMTKLLAKCAMAGVGSNWEELLSTTIQAYHAGDDAVGAAKTRCALGEMYITAGRFEEAETQFRLAEEVFVERKDNALQARVLRLQAHGCMRAGLIFRALKHIQETITLLHAVSEPLGLALAQLERARIFATYGDARNAAKDLLAAENGLSNSGSALNRMRARLVRAECLYVLGDLDRSVHGLKRVLAAVLNLEEAPIRAWVYLLLGQALAIIKPGQARKYLIRSRHLYSTLGQPYHMVRSAILLASVENQLGLDTRGRLMRIRRQISTDWHYLMALHRLIQAEIECETQPNIARQAVLQVREFARENGNRGLLREIDRRLRLPGFLQMMDLDHLTPVEKPQVLASAGEATIAEEKRSWPQPYQISNAPNSHSQTRSKSSLPALLRLVPA